MKFDMFTQYNNSNFDYINEIIKFRVESYLINEGFFYIEEGEWFEYDLPFNEYSSIKRELLEDRDLNLYEIIFHNNIEKEFIKRNHELKNIS